MSVSQAKDGVSSLAARRQQAMLSLSRDGVIGALLAAVGTVGAMIRFNDQLTGLTGDNATYILLARDLVTGARYENAGYPWGYPALLSPILAAAGPDNMLGAIPWMKLLTIVLFVAALPLIYFLLRRRQPAWAAFAATALFAVNDLVLFYANDVMSEMPYACATFGALLLWQRGIDPWLRSKEPSVTPWPRLLLCGVLFVVSYYIRTVGVALLTAPAPVLLWYRKLRPAIVVGALCLLLAVPWLLASQNSNLNSYTDQLLLRNPYNPGLGRISSPGELVVSVLNAGWLYASYIIPSMLLPDKMLAGVPGGSFIQMVVYAVIGLLIVGGLLVRLVRRVELPEVYAAGFLLILFVWPWKSDRFLLPIYPLLLHYMLESGIVISRRLVGVLERVRSVRVSPARLRGAAVALLVLVALPQLWLGAGAAVANARYLAGQAPPTGHTPDWVRYFDAWRWLRDNSPPGSLVMSREPSLTQIYANRPSLQIPLIPAGEYPDYLDGRKVDYVIEDAFTWSTHTRNYLRPALRGYPTLFSLVYSTPAPVVRVWKVVR
jgi:hypothetical protein